jgi:hypothetical protein
MFNRIVNDFNSPRFNLLVPSPEKGGGLAVFDWLVASVFIDVFIFRINFVDFYYCWGN